MYKIIYLTGIQHDKDGLIIYYLKNVLTYKIKKNVNKHEIFLHSLIALLKDKIISPTDKITIATDSFYLIKSCTAWLDIWKKNGWKKANGDNVKYIKLWIEIDNYLNEYKEIKWKYINFNDNKKILQVINKIF